MLLLDFIVQHTKAGMAMRAMDDGAEDAAKRPNTWLASVLGREAVNGSANMAGPWVRLLVVYRE